jgi:hypothetical protein
LCLLDAWFVDFPSLILLLESTSWCTRVDLPEACLISFSVVTLGREFLYILLIFYVRVGCVFYKSKFDISGFHVVSIYHLLLHSLAFPCHPPLSELLPY